jgi:hypothetical protein
MGMIHACGDEKDEANLTIDEMTSLEEMLSNTEIDETHF